MKPLSNVKIQWSSEFAYAIGLITTDGNLSPDKRHINFTSKDKGLVVLFADSLHLKNKIGRKARGHSLEKKYFVIQFGDVIFYKFLVQIGLTPNKSKTLGKISVPDCYFFDFLRGHFDGDGTFYSYWDPRWKSSFMFYTVFVSASKDHINWLRKTILDAINIEGYITKSVNDSIYQLKYAKAESLKLLPKLYYDKDVICLTRKRLKAETAMQTNNK